MKRNTWKTITVLLSVCLLSAGCQTAKNTTPTAASEDVTSSLQQSSTATSSVSESAQPSAVNQPAESSQTSAVSSQESSKTSEASGTNTSKPSEASGSQSSEPLFVVVSDGGEETIIVPDVSGKDSIKVMDELSQQGFGISNEAEYHDSIAAGKVIRQSPAAGTQIKKGDTVTLVTSRGPQPRTESSQPRTESSQPRTESSQPRTESSQPRTESSQPRTESSQPSYQPAPDLPTVIDVESVSLNTTSVVMQVGDTVDLDVYFTPANATNKSFTWYWSDASLADINSDGVVTAKAPGRISVNATTYNNKTAVCVITINERQAPSQPSQPVEPSRPVDPQPVPVEQTRIVNYNEPYVSSVLYQDVSDLCARYPDLMRQTSIGYSEKGKNIPCIVMGKGSKKGCIVGGIHAREHISISFVMRSVEELAQAYTNHQNYGEYDVQELLNKYTLYIVPMFNPDGTDISVAGEMPLVDYPGFDADSYKDNANGVNLNRNFPYHWDDIQSINQYRDTNLYFHGKTAGSESETQAMMRLCTENSFEWLLDMHIVGNGMYWRDYHNGVIPNDVLLSQAISNRCGMTAFPMTYETAFGGLENWFRYTFQKPGLCIELIPSSQSSRAAYYRSFNSFFDDAVNWTQTKYIFLEAMKTI